MQRALFEILTKHTSLAVATSDADGTLTMMTPALERILGHAYCPWAENDLPDVLHLFHQDGQTPLLPEEMPIAKARRGETVIDEVVAARPRDHAEGPVFLRCNAEPLRDDAGGIRGAFALVIDITEEWCARSRQAELRDRLIETVNHELRTPVTKLLGHAELLLQSERDDLPPRTRTSVDAMSRAARDLAGLCDTISQLVDLEAMAHADRVRTDVAEHLSVAVDQFRALHGDGVAIAVHLGPGLVADVDPRALARAASELLTNAVTYSPAEAEVVLSAQAVESWLVIRVADQGPGIPREDRQRLLEPFERGNRPGQPTNSRGLGLAYARTIASAHGGTLTLEPNHPRGTIATLRLKRYSAPTTSIT